LAHEGGWQVERGPARELRFRRPDGALLEAPPVEVASNALELLRQEHARAGLEIDERTSLSAWDGTPPDFGAAVEALLQ
jgi:hypothetical protein